jgi:hypothetical protein
MDSEACQATNPLPVLAPSPVALLCSASFFQRCSGTPFLKGHSCPFFKGNLLKKQNQRFVAKGFEPKAAAWAWFLCVCVAMDMLPKTPANKHGNRHITQQN